MANYPFKINIVSKDGSKFSYYTSSFATDAETIVSASKMSEKLLHSGLAAVQYTESIAAPADTVSANEFGHSGGGLVYLSSSYDNPNTGSIAFTDTETSTRGGLDYYTFHGTKVCSVLGLPEGIPIYTENFKLSDSSTDTTNYVTGELISDSVAIKKGFKMSSQARMRSNLVWDHAFGEGFVQWVSGSTSKMVMGYDNVRDVYKIDAPQITGSTATIGTIRNSTLAGAGSDIYLGFETPEAGYLNIMDGGVRMFRMNENKVDINVDGGPSGDTVDFNAYSKDATYGLHVNGETGNVGIGKFATTKKLDIAGTLLVSSHITASSDILAQGNIIGDGSTTITKMATISGSLLRSSGDVVAYYASDERLKNNIKIIDRPIYKLKQLKGVEYEWNGLQNTYASGSLDSGIIAQDVQKVLPQLVQENSKGYLGVRHDRLVGLLVESIKEQQTQIEELKEQIEEIKNG